MNYILFLFLSIITTGYLKAEPLRFKDKLPIWEAIASDGRVFYLF